MNYRVKFIEDAGLLEVEIPEGSEVTGVVIQTPRKTLLVNVEGKPRLDLDVTTGGDVVIGENIVVIKNRTEVRS